MPFTFAHPALVIPLTRYTHRLSLTGLVMGSMAPDFEFILRMKVAENIGHTWPGFWLFDIPVAVLLSLVFHRYVRSALVRHLPGWYRARFNALAPVDWLTYARQHPLAVLVSVALGVLTHFFWDAFTHYDGAFVKQLPGLQVDQCFLGQCLPGFLWMQILSSVVGLVVVQWLIGQLPARPTPTPATAVAYWRSLVLVAGLVLAVRVVAQPAYNRAWSLCFAGMGSVLYALLVVSVWPRSWQPARPPEPGP